MASKKPQRTRGRKKHGGEAALCEFPGCERPRYARGYCATHHRQLMTGGTLAPIRPYRSRAPGNGKFAGLRLSAECIEHVEEMARSRGLSHSAAVVEILEDWLREGGVQRRRSR